MVLAIAMERIIYKSSLEIASVLPHEFALTVFIVLAEFSFERTSIGLPNFFALTVKCIVQPLSIISIAFLRIIVHASTICSVFLPFAYVRFAILVNETAMSFSDAIYPMSLVHLTIVVVENADSIEKLAVWPCCFVLASVDTLFTLNLVQVNSALSRLLAKITLIRSLSFKCVDLECWALTYSKR